MLICHAQRYLCKWLYPGCFISARRCLDVVVSSCDADQCPRWLLEHVHVCSAHLKSKANKGKGVGGNFSSERLRWTEICKYPRQKNCAILSRISCKFHVSWEVMLQKPESLGIYNFLRLPGQPSPKLWGRQGER